MNASEARTHTTEAIDARERAEQEAAEQARLAHEQKILEMVVSMRPEVDKLIEDAAKNEKSEATYVWESYVSDDSPEGSEEFDEREDKYAAYVTMGDQLEAEGFRVSHAGTNLNMFDDSTTGERYQYSLTIDWYPQPEKPKSVLTRLGSKVVKIVKKSRG